MIVLDDESLADPSIRKQPTTSPATSAYSSQPLGPPPVYPGYQSTGYQSFPDPLPPFAPEFDEREPAGPRFIKAFIVAILIYALAGSIVGSIVARPVHRRDMGIKHGSESWDNLFPEDSVVKSATCASERTAWTFTPDVTPGEPFQHMAVLDSTFELLLGSLDLFLIGGPRIQGNVTFVDDPTLSDTARVRVRARMDDFGWSALMDISICKRTLSSMSNGIFISSAASDHLLQSLLLDIVVSMPTNPRTRAQNINELFVGMASMNLDMKISAPYNFGSILFRSNHGSIHVDTIYADDIALKTLNSAVTGFYTVRRQFSLRTTNAPIDVIVAALDSSSGRPTEIVLGTTNAPIRGQIGLHSSSKDMADTYRTVVTTTNAPVDLTYSRIPVNAKLDAFVRTTVAPIRAQIDPAFEGSFQLVTTNSGEVTVHNSSTHNKSGRHREVAWHAAGMHGGRVAQGVASWSPSIRPVDTMGSIRCTTTNQDIELRL